MPTKRQSKVRANPALEREAQDAILAFEQLPEPFVAAYRRLRAEAAEITEDALIRQSTTLTQKFLEVLLRVDPRLSVIDVPDQQALIAFYLAIPRAVFWIVVGREQLLERFLDTVRARLLNVVLDPDLRAALIDPVINVQLDRSWVDAIPWYMEKLDEMIVETRDVLYAAVPELYPWLLEHGVSDEQFQVSLLARVVDMIPVATAQGGQSLSGVFDLGDAERVRQVYGIRAL